MRMVWQRSSKGFPGYAYKFHRYMYNSIEALAGLTNLHHQYPGSAMALPGSKTSLMIRSSICTICAFLCAWLTASNASSQSAVDIGLYQNGNELEVRVRPEMDFQGVFSSIVFTLRWDADTHVDLEHLQQPSDAAAYIPLQPSGGVRVDGDRKYQVFAGFGFNTLQETGSPWRAGREYTIARIPFTGKAIFELTRDTYAKLQDTNADYYVSLGGEDRTGMVYKELAGEAGDIVALSILPNPNRGQFVLTIPMLENDAMWYEIVNSAGQVIANETPTNITGGRLQKEMDLASEGAGVYMLRIHRKESTETHRIVVN